MGGQSPDRQELEDESTSPPVSQELLDAQQSKLWVPLMTAGALWFYSDRVALVLKISLEVIHKVAYLFLKSLVCKTDSNSGSRELSSDHQQSPVFCFSELVPPPDPWDQHLQQRQVTRHSELPS